MGEVCPGKAENIFHDWFHFKMNYTLNTCTSNGNMPLATVLLLQLCPGVIHWLIVNLIMVGYVSTMTHMQWDIVGLQNQNGTLWVFFFSL